MNRRLLAVCSMLLLAFAGCAVLFPTGERDDFIRVKGTRFIHNGRPYYFGGANFWYGCYLGSPGRTGNRERLRLELDSLSAIGLVNLRILAASEESYMKRSIRPAITRSPGVYDDSLFQGLDYLLAEMAERRMHGVLFLNNYWEWSGGMVQYNVWAGAEGVDPEKSPGGWKDFMNFSASFYANEKANSIFRDYVRRIVTRRNTCNGRLYSEDPTIMAWQLANEPRPGTSSPEGEKNLESYYGWIEQTAAYIHSLDTNHLVSTGSEGAVGFYWSSEYALKTHQSPFIDYATFHLWPVNWSWFDPKRFEETLPATEEKAMSYIREHLAVARQLNKPITLEEFGIARDSARCAPGSPTSARDRYFTKILSALGDSASAGAPFAGWNIWTWGGVARREGEDDVWRPGDPFTGDPPQEPQGFNSVFIVDTSTLRIIRENAGAMMRLGARDSLFAGGAASRTEVYQK